MTNGFTTEQILVRLEEKVDKLIQDHENRIRSLESGHNRLKGALAFISFAVVVVGAIVGSLNL